MKFIINLNFSGTDTIGIILDGFLPVGKANGLHLDLTDGRYVVVAYMSDRQKQKGNVSDFPPSDLNGLTPLRTVMCRALTVEIEDTQPNPNVVSSLKAKEVTTETEEYAYEIANLVIQIHNGVVEYFRNFARQVWLEPIVQKPNDSKTLKYLINELAIMWVDSDGALRPLALSTGGPMVAFKDFRTDFGRSVGKDEWNRVAPFVELFIENNKSAPLLKVLLSNSRRHLDIQDGRLAVVEAVIALESAIKQFLPKTILRIPGAPQIEEKLLDKLIEEAGLRLSTNVILNMIAPATGIKSEEIQSVLVAVEERNKIIHQRQRKVELPKAKRYVLAIERVVETLERLAEGEPVADMQSIDV